MKQMIRVNTGADLGRTIAVIRSAQSISQADLAELVGLSPNYISKIETGRTWTILEHELRVLRRLGATITIEVPSQDPQLTRSG